MGSGVSQLKCPKEYDSAKFQNILQLFDRLDCNGDHVVETEELNKISQLHVNNKIRQLLKNKEQLISKQKQEFYQLDSLAANQIAEIKTNLDLDKKQLKETTAAAIDNIDNNVKNLRDMTDDEKSKKFKKAITNKEGKISFWQFFDYMKYRTTDIQNIVW